MQDNKFYRIGKFIYRLRWGLIGLWLAMILACVPFIPNLMTPFKSTGFTDENAESGKTQEYIDKKLKYNNYNKILILYHSNSLKATDPEYIDKVKESLSKLKNFPIKTQILYPDENKEQISKDKHTAYAVVIVKSSTDISNKLLKQLKEDIKTPKNMTIQIGGEPIFIENVNEQTQIDLYKADFIATPVSLITLILVFGSLFAAFLPIVLGGGGALIILTALFFLGHLFTLSVFTLNIALLLGLCLILDYALFIISRFRDELKDKQNVEEAIAVTQATAGKAILFSALAVFASLSALLLFPVNILFSMGIGGMVAVLVAVIMSFVFLPAILSVLNTKINLLPVKIFKKYSENHSGFWHWLAEKVVKRPLIFFFSILIFLLLLGYPFLNATFGVSDYRIFPEHSEYRRFYDTYADKFNKKELDPIVILVKTKTSILSEENISNLYDLTRKLKHNSAIKKIHSIVNADENLTKSQYYALYHLQKNLMSLGVKKLLDTTTRHYMTLITIISQYPADSPNTKNLIKELRDHSSYRGMKLSLTGTPVANDELLDSISKILPYAILWIMISTYLILLLLLRSLFLPIKAILMTMLSLLACYGALVLVFQDGYLHELLNFDPQGMVDISLLVIIFCALFGFSMDYEVFLLTRIKEAYESLGDNEKSIIFGIEKSSRIITSAAIIVICICFSFLVADVLLVKAFGLGIAVAIFVDAFLIRTFLVPATMTLLKKWNWYLPRWLDKILPKL